MSVSEDMSILCPQFSEAIVLQETAGHGNNSKNEGTRCQAKEYVFKGEDTHG